MPGAARFVMEDMVEDVTERLAFVRHQPARSLVLGDYTGKLASTLPGDVVQADITGWNGAAGTDLERPFAETGFDLIASLGLLDTVNDLPGALIHMRSALAPGGMAIASMTGGESLSTLRRIMLAADGERPAGRIHPMVDVRSGAQLLQRAGWADPVVDSHKLSVRYGSLERLIDDLRAQGMGNCLASPSAFSGKQGWGRALEAFAQQADADGRVSETFEIITLTGRRR